MPKVLRSATYYYVLVRLHEKTLSVNGFTSVTWMISFVIWLFFAIAKRLHFKKNVYESYC